MEENNRYSKLRNAIIHNSSNIPDEKDNEYIIRLIKADKKIEYTKQGDFYIKDVLFLKEFSKLLFEFFTLLVDNLAVTKVIARNTSMPHDNTAWGKEKTENLLTEIVHGLNLLNNEKRTDEFKEVDLKNNLKGLLGTMAFDLIALTPSYFFIKRFRSQIKWTCPPEPSEINK